MSEQKDLNNFYQKDEIDAKFNQTLNAEDYYTKKITDKEFVKKTNMTKSDGVIIKAVADNKKELEDKIATKADTSKVYSKVEVDKKLGEKLNTAYIDIDTRLKKLEETNNDKNNLYHI